MRCVAAAKSCRRRSTSCCQCSASDDPQKLLCGSGPCSSFAIFFPFLLWSVLGLWPLWRDLSCSRQERGRQPMLQQREHLVGHHVGTRLVLFLPPVNRSHQQPHQQMRQQPWII